MVTELVRGGCVHTVCRLVSVCVCVCMCVHVCVRACYQDVVCWGVGVPPDQQRDIG